MQISFSQLQVYGQCPRQYEFAFVKKLSRVISAGESFGSSVHNALKKWGEEEVKAMSHKRSAISGQLTLLPQDGAVRYSSQLTDDRLRALWHQSFIVEGYPSKAEADAARVRGEKLMEHFYEWWQKEERDVIAVEAGFSIPITGHQSPTTLTGRFDRVERDGEGVRIIDFKTTVPRDQASADADLQLSIYALAAQEAFGLPCTTLSLLFLSENGVIERITRRSASHLGEAQEQIARLRTGMAAGDFSPSPSPTKCHRCPFRNVCDAAVP